MGPASSCNSVRPYIKIKIQRARECGSVAKYPCLISSIGENKRLKAIMLTKNERKGEEAKENERNIKTLIMKLDIDESNRHLRCSPKEY